MKYFTKDDANHLLDSLKKHYEDSTDWEGRNYLGSTIDWNYGKEYVDIPIPEHVKKALDRLQHPRPNRPQYDPHRWTVPSYGKRLQMAPYLDDSELLENKSTKRIQSVVGTMIYYSRSSDPTILQANNEISRSQSKPTRDTGKKARMLLDHSATYQNEII